ncbi:sensor histidine kinase [Amycolatopsis keratiniphila]|uniref:sensor histidine kinase n=1 Tax=Amycolatopsis keratiniphila TaxID=129921 RepID=UPI00087948FE|nr:histidine kinase [Amycolatopsis keratiniphila]OLZ43664.1 two-component sensor histidine kinase [Amycolatopsis keratiniphila subsp. nogabecina]SDU10250.1 Signal transduction histidine kinase [Amycolatopsis keratiniphila]
MLPTATPRPVRGLVIAEIVVLAGLNIEQLVRRLILDGPAPAGEILYFAAGLVLGALALLRRRFPARTATLTASGIVLSLACSAAGFLFEPAAAPSGDAEALALAVLVGAACHRLPRGHAAVLAVLGGLTMAAAPVLRFTDTFTTLSIAVVWALLWGCSVIVGLMLRDGEARREAALAAARDRERLALARELHDLVAHHITGVVVRTQAAGVILADGPEQELIKEIEQAGAEALGAVRRLVMMLRSPELASQVTAGGLVETIEAAVGDDEGVTVRLADGLAELAVAPETVSTVHRVVLESLNNARRHAPDARSVTVLVEPVDGRRYLRVEVANDGLRPGRVRRSPGGYGLIGMAERIAALDGTLTAGADGERGWRVLAELPLPGGVSAAAEPEGGAAR